MKILTFNCGLGKRFIWEILWTRTGPRAIRNASFVNMDPTLHKKVQTDRAQQARSALQRLSHTKGDCGSRGIEANKITVHGVFPYEKPWQDSFARLSTAIAGSQ